jgi:3-isopropylmalate dehydrogenase
MQRSQRHEFIVLAGDGIGPEVIAQAVRVLDWFATRRGLEVVIRHEDFGADAWLRTGRFLRDEVLADLMTTDAVLFGAFGGTLETTPVPTELRRRFGLLRIRKEMGLFANVRPVRAFDALDHASPLRPEVSRGVDFVVVRELIGGIYFGEPRGITDLGGGERRAIDTQVYTSAEIRRAGRFAFELAGARRRHLTSVDKANVMASGALWREEMSALATEHPGITVDHRYADACAAELITRPGRFDVIVTDNLFGDILSDAAAAITGSLGMLPSASFSERDPSGRRRAFYEPVHGSAPDIAGRGIANPCGAILSVALALDATLGLPDDARTLESAVGDTLTRVRTADIADPRLPTVGTRQFGDAVLAALERTRQARGQGG